MLQVHRKRGFTLVELLVVIAIIGILVGLLLPAVQAAREAARRTECANKLKQWGLAAQSYHDTYRILPPAVLGQRRTTGWAMMLPFVEQSALHDRYNFHASSTSSENANLVLQNRLELMLCPSAPTSGEEVAAVDDDPDCPLIRAQAAYRTSYLFSTGHFTDEPGVGSFSQLSADVRRGAFGNNASARFRDITDGLSNTIAIGEALGGARYRTHDFGNGDLDNQGLSGPWGIMGVFTCCHGIIPSESEVEVVISSDDAARYHINARWPEDERGRSHSWGFSSRHPGGAQFVFADGSTHLLTDTMDYLVFATLAYIASDEPIEWSR